MLLWNTPTEQSTTRAESSGTTPKYRPVVHKVGVNEKYYPIELDLDDAKLADISDNDSVSLVYRTGDIFQLFNLKTGKASTSLAKPNVGAFTCLLSPDTRSLALAAESAFSLWDVASSQQTWHSSDAKPPTKARSHPKWAVTLSGTLRRIVRTFRLSGDSPSVSIGLNGTPLPRPICSIPLEERPLDVYEWVEDDRKLRVFSRRAAQVTPEQIRAHQQMLKDAGFNPGLIDGVWGRGTEDATRRWEAATGGAQQSYCYTDIEWDPPETIEEPILDLARLVIGKRFNEKREMVSIPDKERIDLRRKLETAKVRDPRWRKLLDWWLQGRPGD